MPTPSASITFRLAGSSHGTTGRRCSSKRWPGAPSEMPISSSWTASACTILVVAPMVKADALVIWGGAV